MAWEAPLGHNICLWQGKRLRRGTRVENKVIQLARSVIAKENGRRPETDWIQQRADRLAKKEGIKSRDELDRFLFEKMYGRAPEKMESVKIRYWRTGRHLPSSREAARDFAQALDLDMREADYFLKACLERCDRVFHKKPDPTDEAYPVYVRRRQLMEEMLSEYIAQIPPARMIQMNVPYKNLSAYARHLYCLDAMSATALSAESRMIEIAENHFSSSNYESEFLRTRNLLGEIPRRTMLRHILLLGLPYLNLRLINERLDQFGYLPLTRGHTSQRGAYLDDLVIGLIELYEDACKGCDPLTCRHWLLEQMAALDQYLLKHGKDEYRFMYFRVLSTMAEYEETL